MDAVWTAPFRKRRRILLALAATATVQLLLPVPFLATALGDKHAGRPVFGGVGPRLMRVVLLALAGASLVWPWTTAHPTGWLADTQRAFRRGGQPFAGDQPARGL